MEFSIKTANLEKDSADCLILGVYQDGGLTAAAQQIDGMCDGNLTQLVTSEDFDAKAGNTLMLHQQPLASSRVLLVGLGEPESLDAKTFCKANKVALKAIKSAAIKQVITTLPDAAVADVDTQAKVAFLAQSMVDAAYQVNAIKKESKPSLHAEQSVVISVAKGDLAAAEAGLVQGKAIANGANYTKDLGNLPSNICTPTYLAEQAVEVGQSYGFEVEILEESDCEALGMGSFLSVTKGAEEPAKFIIMQHQKGAKDQKPIVLVGKGITFDTGGISLKPGAAMDEMKYDMGGAASVFGTMKAIGEMDLPLNVVAIVPSCENMPDALASKPGDIVTSMSGQTIEILNTDAEGRLILCDALTYAEKFEPMAVVDIATLTGACIIALGHHATAVYSNEDSLAKTLIDAGEKGLDRAWHMPLWDEYQPQLESNFADMANIGGRPAGSITAACFLSRYTENYTWAHLDIAGTAWKSGGKDKGSTGRPVPMLTTYLIEQAKALN